MRRRETSEIADLASFYSPIFIASPPYCASAFRWYEEKIDIFIKSYQRWVRHEVEAVGPLVSKNASDLRVARAIVALVIRDLRIRK
jgi:hypothetical protein